MPPCPHFCKRYRWRSLTLKEKTKAADSKPIGFDRSGQNNFSNCKRQLIYSVPLFIFYIIYFLQIKVNKIRIFAYKCAPNILILIKLSTSRLIAYIARQLTTTILNQSHIADLLLLTFHQGFCIIWLAVTNYNWCRYLISQELAYSNSKLK